MSIVKHAIPDQVIRSDGGRFAGRTTVVSVREVTPEDVMPPSLALWADLTAEKRGKCFTGTARFMWGGCKVFGWSPDGDPKRCDVWYKS